MRFLARLLLAPALAVAIVAAGFNVIPASA
jgi:hypothetical protein